MPTTADTPAHTVPDEVIADARKRLALYALRRGYKNEPAEDRRARTRGDAFAEARQLKRAHGGDHQAIIDAITPTDEEVAALAAERLGKAAAKNPGTPTDTPADTPAETPVEFTVHAEVDDD